MSKTKKYPFKKVQDLIGKTVTLRTNNRYNSGGIYYLGGDNTKIKVKEIRTHSGGITINDATQVYINNSQYVVYLAELEFSAEGRESMMENISDLKKQILNAQEQIADFERKIQFMDLYKLDEFSETEYKVWAVLETIKTAKDDVEKAKAIAKLIASE